MAKSSSKELIFRKISLISLLIFLGILPFSIKTIYYSPVIYSSGKFNPYLTSFLYCSDILLFISLFFWGVSLFFQKTKINLGNKKIFLGLILFFIFSQISLSQSKENLLISFFALFRLLEGIIFYLLFINLSIKTETFSKILILTFSFQSFISLLQYYQQKSLGLFVLGESFLSPNITGVAKIDLLNNQFIRGYGTLPHPNILGGLLMITIFLTISIYAKNKKLALTALILQILGLISTFSRSALLAAIGAFLIFLLNKNIFKINYKKIFFIILLSLLIIIISITFTPFSKRYFSLPTKTEFSERLLYYQLIKKMLLQYPFGIGLNQFTKQMDNFTDQKLLPWEHQPVHNTFLLIANETGIYNLIIIILFFFYGIKSLIKNNKKLLPEEWNKLNHSLLAILTGIFILFNFDHYFLTNYQSFMMLIFIISLISLSLEKQGLNIKKISSNTKLTQ